MFEPRYFRRHPPIRRAAPRRASQVARVTTWSLAVLLKKKKTYLIRFAFGKPSTWWPSLQRLASISIYQTDYGAHECDTAVWEGFSFLCACYLKIEENRHCRQYFFGRMPRHQRRHGNTVVADMVAPNLRGNMHENTKHQKGNPSMTLLPWRAYGLIWEVALRFDLDRQYPSGVPLTDTVTCLCF
jgi:hypothetical protein